MSAGAPLHDSDSLPTLLLGGSFDPVHQGHVALAALFSDLLAPARLRLVPAGRPWQKRALQANPAQRVAMLALAFEAAALPFAIDRQEIERADQGRPSFTIDTLRALRAELGPQAPLVCLMGADQLQQLDSWRDWEQLFDFAHIAVAARPGAALDTLAPAVQAQLTRRAASCAQLRSTPAGHTYLARTLAVDISATALRASLQRGETPDSLMAPVVLDYIQQQHLYKS
ncbi:MAG: nicotinate-nucleotide adenylyltransferase [Pseudomonadota bacterium]